MTRPLSNNRPARIGLVSRIKGRLGRIVRRALDVVRDDYTIPKECPSSPFQTRLARTFRYRAAAIGMPLTANERRLVHLKNQHRGERVFVLGNGPSLTKCDLLRLDGECTFAVNNIFLIADEFGFVPSYYVVEDILLAEDRARQINAYQGPTKFFGNYLRYCLDDTPDTLWLNVRMHYHDYPGFPYFSTNAARQLWVGGTVSYLCMQLAYFMGFSEVYLIGFDHSYKVPPTVDKEGTRWTSRDDDPNHFHPEYFGKGYRWHDPQVDRMEQAYVRAREAFDADGRLIRNATVGGRLEVFERADYSSLFR